MGRLNGHIYQYKGRGEGSSSGNCLLLYIYCIVYGIDKYIYYTVCMYYIYIYIPLVVYNVLNVYI